MKKIYFIIFALLFLAVFFSPLFVFAQARISVSSVIPSTNPTAGSSVAPGAYISNFYQLALLLGGVLAFGAVVYGGVLYAISGGNASKQSEGKEWIQSALLGLLLLAGAYLILYTINPNLVDLTLPGLSGLQGFGGNAGFAPGGSVSGSNSNSLVSGKLTGLAATTLTDLNDLQQACTQQVGHTCSVIVTSGVTGAHSANGTCTHADGCKADISPTPDINSYILSLPRANPATRSDGAALYKAPDGSIFANELTKPSNCGSACNWTGAHWDMKAGGN